MVTAGIFPFKENSHGRAGNRTRDLMISNQRRWPLDHQASLGVFNIQTPNFDVEYHYQLAWSQSLLHRSDLLFPKSVHIFGTLKQDSHTTKCITKHAHFPAPNVYKYLIHGSHLLLGVRTPQQEHDISRVIADVFHDGICQLLPALVLVWIGTVRSNREDRIEQQHTWTKTTEPFQTRTMFDTEY